MGGGGPAPLTFGTCGSFTACGGDPTGNWTLTGGCVEDPILPLKELCPTATASNLTGTVQGHVDISGTAQTGTIARTVAISMSADVSIPPQCLSPTVDCNTWYSTIRQLASSTSCTPVDGGCGCSVEYLFGANDATSYSADAGVLQTATDRYEFCRDGNTLQYRIVGPVIGGIYDVSL